MTIRATDDEVLAAELWGEYKKWDKERQQYVPVKSVRVTSAWVGERGPELVHGFEGEEVGTSAGDSSTSSQTSTEKPIDESAKTLRQTVPTTAQPSNRPPMGSSTAHSTGGPGKAE